MAETMVEKVARIVAEKQCHIDQASAANTGCDVLLLVDGYLPWAREIVRTVMEEMREPTERMISEGESAASYGIGKPPNDEALPLVWQWMIDAALQEE